MIVLTVRSALLQNSNISNNEVIEDFQSGWSMVTNGGDGSIEDDTVNYINGTKGLKLNVIRQGVNVDCKADKTINIDLVKNKIFSVDIFLHDDVSNYKSIYIYMSSTTGFAVTFSYAITASYYLSKGWNRFLLHYSSFTNTGGDSWGKTMQKMRVQLRGADNKSCSATLGGINYGFAFKPKVIIRFDDGDDDVYQNAFPILQAFNFKSSMYVNGARVGIAPASSLEHLLEMQNAGMDIGNHGYDHPNYAGMSVQDIQKDIEDNIQFLESNGFLAAKHLAIPNGVDDANTRQAIGNCDLTTVTNSTGYYFYPNDFTPRNNYLNNRINVSSYMVDLNRIPGVGVTNADTLADVKGWVDAAIAKEQTIVLMFHKINGTASGTYEWLTSNFQSLCEYLEQRKIDVVSMTEFYDQLTNPRKFVSRA